MSFEGFDQYLCAKGHSWEKDAYDYGDVVCPVCDGNAVWWNQVDETNGSFDDDGNRRIDGYVELEANKSAVYCTCATCGNAHVAEVATYKLPASDVGHHGIVRRECSPYSTE
jgi:hypothetical protein